MDIGDHFEGTQGAEDVEQKSEKEYTESDPRQMLRFDVQWIYGLRMKQVAN